MKSFLYVLLALFVLSLYAPFADAHGHGKRGVGRGIFTRMKERGGLFHRHR